MAVLSCTLTLGDYSAMPIPGIDTEFDIPYTIITDNVNETAATIYATGLLPARYTPFSGNMFATVRRVALHREKQAPKIWRAVVHYSSVPLTEKEEEKNSTPNPSNRLAEIEWEATPYQMPLWVSVNGQRICNSAGDDPDPVPEKTDYHWVANVTKNVSVIPPWLLDYPGKVNRFAYTIEGLPVLAKASRLVSLRLSKKLREGTFGYRTITMGIEFRSRRKNGDTELPLAPIYEAGDFIARSYKINDKAAPPFDLELPDIGLHRYDFVTGKLTRIKTSDTPPQNVSQPVPLNGSGQPVANPSLESAYGLTWQIYETRDFSVLPLT